MFVCQSQRGVSTIELAIVITVIGLLMAVVVGGVKLQKAAELRSVISDVTRFMASIEGFKSQYESLPGDMDNAVDVFGSDTANGDGDDLIEYPTSGNIESLRGWQQLTLSSFLDGSYVGTAGDGADQADIGINVPASKRAKVGYYLITDHINGGTSRHAIRVGAYRASNPNNNAAFTALEAQTIDAKLDDDDPEAGRVQAAKGNDIVSELCQNPSGTGYNISNDDKNCIIEFPAFP